MESPLEQIRDQQKATWNKFSPGWKKWDIFNMRFLQPMGEAIIAHLQLKSDDEVLDIATGTGEPGLTIAILTNRGKVTGTDLSEEMLALAATHAAERQIKNYRSVLADACELPFADNSFDAISCRMGFMFFPDMELAAREMFRVLRPGGRIATSVWGTAEMNPWITTVLNTLNKNMETPPPPPGAPGMFRCSRPGLMTDLLARVGFSHTAEQYISGQVEYGSPERYWENMTDCAAPVVNALSRADAPTRARIEKEIFDQLRPIASPGSLALDYTSIILYGEKDA